MALASAAQEAVWMRELCADRKSQPSDPTMIYEDNQSDICMARNPQYSMAGQSISTSSFTSFGDK